MICYFNIPKQIKKAILLLFFPFVNIHPRTISDKKSLATNAVLPLLFSRLFSRLFGIDIRVDFATASVGTTRIRFVKELSRLRGADIIRYRIAWRVESRSMLELTSYY